MSNIRESNALSEIATKVGSTKDIVKQLNRAFYKVPKTVSDKDPAFLSAVTLDFNTARAVAKTNHLDAAASQMTQNAEGARSIVAKMPELKETAAFYAEYVSLTDPEIKKARDALLEKENFEQSMRVFIQEDLHDKLPHILKDLRGKSKSEIKNALAPMIAQEKNMTPKIEKLEVTIQALRKTLENLHKTTFNLMPLSARASFNPPTGTPEKSSNKPGLD